MVQEYATQAVRNLRKMGYDVTCELQNVDSYGDCFLLRFEVKDNEIKYVFSHVFNSREIARVGLENWLTNVLGV
jgi:hypothetical protein